MKYVATLEKEGRYVLAFFPDCPGCQTQADPGEDIAVQAAEALEGWLESTLAGGELPPRPSKRAPKGTNAIWVEVPPRLAVKLELRWARAAARLTQAQLARRAGVSQPMIAKLEHPDYNPTIATLEKVAAALGTRLEVSLASIEAPAAH